MLEIHDYEEKYAKQIDELDNYYWVLMKDESIKNEYDDNSIIKVALLDGKLVGFIDSKITGDLLDLRNILVYPDYQKHGIASELLSNLFEKIKNKNINNIIAYAVDHDNKINSEKLLYNFGFKKLYKVNDYWGSLYPNHYCRQCNSNNCHCGVVVFLKEMSNNYEH